MSQEHEPVCKISRKTQVSERDTGKKEEEEEEGEEEEEEEEEEKKGKEE